jgi:outer membrane immunogenic protein
MTRAAILSGAALAAFLAVPAASAADLPSRKSPLPYAPEPVFTWTGFHVGVNQGFGGGVLDANVSLAGVGVLNNTQTTNRASGFFIGGEAGYDYQFSNNVVLGVETDMQWSDLKASHQATSWSSTGAAGSGNANIRNDLNWFGTTRLRLGYSFGRLLPYVTGGVAYGEVAASGEQEVGGALFSASATQTKVVGRPARVSNMPCPTIFRRGPNMFICSFQASTGRRPASRRRRFRLWLAHFQPAPSGLI